MLSNCNRREKKLNCVLHIIENPILKIVQANACIDDTSYSIWVEKVEPMRFWLFYFDSMFCKYTTGMSLCDEGMS